MGPTRHPLRHDRPGTEAEHPQAPCESPPGTAHAGAPRENTAPSSPPLTEEDPAPDGDYQVGAVSPLPQTGPVTLSAVQERPDPIPINFPSLLFSILSGYRLTVTCGGGSPSRVKHPAARETSRGLCERTNSGSALARGRCRWRWWRELSSGNGNPGNCIQNPAPPDLACITASRKRTNPSPKRHAPSLSGAESNQETSGAKPSVMRDMACRRSLLPFTSSESSTCHHMRSCMAGGLRDAQGRTASTYS